MTSFSKKGALLITLWRKQISKPKFGSMACQHVPLISPSACGSGPTQGLNSQQLTCFEGDVPAPHQGFAYENSVRPTFLQPFNIGPAMDSTFGDEQ